ncbi:hypothetical protein LCGC14_1582800 [marine sediment metagenome]|uniref:Uncharacterized protein n=1 Tax=marine sediment metagenome TaxID=412755 RepID=A0A0F9LGJ0_9ZZZZ
MPNKDDASGNNVPDPKTPPPPASPPPSTDTPKFELKDGVMTVDGRKVVSESDLIAAKKSLESAAEQAQTVHNDAIDKSKLELSESLQQVASLNAKLQEAEKARDAGATPNTDVAGIKEKLESAESRIEALTTEAGESLEMRRAFLALKYTIPVDSLSEKNKEQLDSFEEALKAVATSRGGSPGPYAIGGTGADTKPPTDMERARSILDNTPIRGVRTAEAQKV